MSCPLNEVIAAQMYVYFIGVFKLAANEANWT